MTLQSEAQWVCPFCSKVSFEEPTQSYGLDDIMVCQYCKSRSIIDSVIYIIHTRMPE